MKRCIAACMASFALGVIVGCLSYYRYANHMYMEHPEFFKAALEYKIAQRSR